ncbi:hypothetical protein BJ165DRAFT_693739 [Panaeolus papilionaceus]|nr:hypothetical protein BJ165DRAFT_693739 [Panaeolus papilionaceus]
MTNVFYQTTTAKSPRPTILYPSPGTHSSFLTQYQTQAGEHGVPPDIIPSDLPPSLSSLNPRAIGAGLSTPRAHGPDTPTPATYFASRQSRIRTISATSDQPTSPNNEPSTSTSPPEWHHPHASNGIDESTTTLPITQINGSNLPQPVPQMPLSNGQLVPVLTHHNHNHNHTADELGSDAKDRSLSPRPSDSTSNSSSPAPSSSTGYATSISRSPSPHSSPGSPPSTAVPITRHSKGEHDDGHRGAGCSFDFLWRRHMAGTREGSKGVLSRRLGASRSMSLFSFRYHPFNARISPSTSQLLP